MDTPRLLHSERIVSAARSIDLGRGAAMFATIALTSAAIGSGLYLQDRALTSGSDASRTTLANWSDPRLPRPRPLADEPPTTGSINPLNVAPALSLQDEIALVAANAGEADTRDRLRDKAVLIASAWTECGEVTGSEVLETIADRLVVRIECGDAIRFYLDEAEIEASRPTAAGQPVPTALTDAEALNACEAKVRVGLPHPSSLQRSLASTGVTRAPGSHAVVSFEFQALNGLGFPLALQAHCVFDEHRLARLEVSPR
jgi:hypothetical protein